MTKSFDLIVIGSGPSGRRAAIQAAKRNRTVLVIENRSQIGGVSAHVGTLPSKTFRETVLNLSGYRERVFYGSSYRVKSDIDGADILKRIAITVNHEVNIFENQLYRNRVETILGAARFVGDKTISVTTKSGNEVEFNSERIIIAVGSKPFRPHHIPFDGHKVIDSDDLANNPTVPQSLTVVGAGVIGVEYATIFAALDVEVTIIEPRSNFLEFVDREIIGTFLDHLKDRGIKIILGSSVDEVHLDEAGVVVSSLSSGEKIQSEMLLYASGRIGAVSGLDLKNCGLSSDDRGRIKVNPKTFQTAVPHIYAVGDVIGAPSLASIAMEQGRVAACHAMLSYSPALPAYYPYGIYALPEIAAIGITEQQVEDQKIPYICGVARFSEVTRGHILGLNSGMLKLIFATDTFKLLGVHIVGEGATELIHVGQAVLNLGGTLDYFIQNAFNYPTLAEAYKIAALDAFNRSGIIEQHLRDTFQEEAIVT